MTNTHPVVLRSVRGVQLAAMHHRQLGETGSQHDSFPLSGTDGYPYDESRACTERDYQCENGASRPPPALPPSRGTGTSLGSRGPGPSPAPLARGSAAGGQPRFASSRLLIATAALEEPPRGHSTVTVPRPAGRLPSGGGA
jgi:hypothetical protein